MNKKFVGWRSTLEKLNDLIFTQRCQRVALFGLGGIGKTQSAIEFVHQAKESCAEFSIFWVSAQSVEAFRQSYIDIAVECGVAVNPKTEDPRQAVKWYLRFDISGKWLMIVDNADDRDLLHGSGTSQQGMLDFLPETQKGLILFTNRSEEEGRALADLNVVQIDNMGRQEGQTLLENAMGTSKLKETPATNTELLEELTFLPLAIAHAGAFLSISKMPIQDYISLIKKTEKDKVSMLSRKNPDSQGINKGKKDAVMTTWQISFDHIRQHHEHAAVTLLFMSRIEPKAIPLGLLPLNGPESLLMQSVTTLCSYAFLTTREDRLHYYDMHELFHLSSKQWKDMDDHQVNTAY